MATTTLDTTLLSNLFSMSLDVDFRDARLTTRCQKILHTLASSPNSSFPQACKDKHQLKLLYRFLSNPKVEHTEISTAITQDTMQKLGLVEDLIIVAQDTTEFDFTTKPDTPLGYLHKLHQNGFLCHSALAITTQGLPIGILWQKYWLRERQEFGKKKDRKKKSIHEKESYRWIECLEKLDALNKKSSTPKHFLVTADRESDILDLFLFQPNTAIDLLIRCSHNRILSSHDFKLLDTLEKESVQGTITFTIAHSGHLPDRDVTCSLKWIPIKLSQDSKELYLIQAFNQEQDLDWKLLTTLPITSLEAARQVVYFYHLRWLVERFHYTLKSGCKVEELQLQDQQRLNKAVSLYSLVATRILLLTYLARLMPSLSCLVFFQSLEWQVIYTYIHKQAPSQNCPTPTIAEVTIWLAKMGGYLTNKKSPPGVKTIWTGLKLLYTLVEYEQIRLGGDEGNG